MPGYYLCVVLRYVKLDVAHPGIIAEFACPVVRHANAQLTGTHALEAGTDAVAGFGGRMVRIETLTAELCHAGGFISPHPANDLYFFNLFTFAFADGNILRLSAFIDLFFHYSNVNIC